MSDAKLPGSGRLDGTAHFYPVRVYFEDVDAAGIVYHANYLRYAERARTEMMRALGVPHAGMLAETGVAFAVRSCEIDYRRAARLEEALEIATIVVDIGPAVLELEQVVRRMAAAPGLDAPAGEDLVRIRLRLCCINQSGRPVRVPAPVRTALDRLFVSAAGAESSQA